jgi:hypothetical protein
MTSAACKYLKKSLASADIANCEGRKVGCTEVLAEFAQKYTAVLFQNKLAYQMQAMGITCTCSGVSVCVLLCMSQDMSAGKYGMRTQMWSAFERRICSLKVVSLCSKGMSDCRKMLLKSLRARVYAHNSGHMCAYIY